VDVDFFFRQRTDFIRRFYDEAVKPFLETQRLIEAREEPYVPPYSEDGEPPFLTEWIDADTCIQILGRTAISMLSESLKLYFIQWERLLHIDCYSQFKTDFGRGGYWSGYRKCFGEGLGFDWASCPADQEIIAQVTLARNQSQHAGSITSLSVTHPRNIRERFVKPIFVHEHEKALVGEELESLSWLGSDLIISRDALLESIRQTEFLVDWLEPQLQKVRWGH